LPIKVLPPEVAAKIAAGEVVERPASVVKELVENAIDAGASSIRILIKEGGRRFIRVEDDGCGIPADEVSVAFARHATSKLKAIEDLERIRTLGFRGEALASIAAVSHLTLVTRENPTQGSAAASLAATKVSVEGGVVTAAGPEGAPPGTAVTVEHLFYNVPARLKFLKAPATESGHIHRVIANYAVAYPEIRFQLTLDQRLALQTSGSGQLQNVLVDIWGLDVVRDMIPIGEAPSAFDAEEEERAAEETANRISVAGYAGLPSLHRAQRNQLIFFVNRRWIQDRSLNAAVSQAYQTLLPIGRHPVAVLNIQIDPAEVDVNVHPTKSEVKFRDSRAVFSAVQRAVRAAVVAAAGPPEMGLSGSSWQEAGGNRTSTQSGGFTSGGHGSWRQMSNFGIEVQRTLPSGASAVDEDPRALQSLPVLRVLGQLGQTYIIAEGPDGLYLIDQHAAHERVLYERLQAGLATASVPSQRLLEPITVELSPSQAAVLGAEMTTMTNIGFEIEAFGGSTYRVSAVPQMLAQTDVARALVDILEEMAEGAVPLARQADERVKITVCKRASIKGGQTLSMQEMQALIRQLEQSTSPRTCPHGRPTMIHISAAHLAREFGRH
jgi:DNA mismatch repair protein MutL